MSGQQFPSDIWQQADETLVSIVEDGLAPSDPGALLSLKRHIATGLLREREQFQTDVIAAVADEPEACRRKVFAAIRRGFQN